MRTPERHLPVYFHGSIPLREIEEALHSRGMHLRGDGRGRIFAERVPPYLTRPAEAMPLRTVASPLRRVAGRRG